MPLVGLWFSMTCANFWPDFDAEERTRAGPRTRPPLTTASPQPIRVRRRVVRPEIRTSLGEY